MRVVEKGWRGWDQLTGDEFVAGDVGVGTLGHEDVGFCGEVSGSGE